MGLVTIERKRERDLALEKAMRTGNAAQVKMKGQKLNQRLDAKHIGCIIRPKIRAVGYERIKTAGRVPLVEN